MVKSFILKRDEYTIAVPITATIGKLYQILKKQFGNEEIEYVANPKFYYPMGTINKLDSSVKEIHQYRIPEGAKIIMMAKSCFRWSTTNKPENLEVGFCLPRSPIRDFQWKWLSPPKKLLGVLELLLS